MIEVLAEVFKAYLLPGSLSFLLLAVSVGVVLLFLRGRSSNLGRIWLAGVAIGYWLLASPWAARALVWSLSHGYQAISSPNASPSPGAIVVLGGGSVTNTEDGRRLSALSDASALRALEGARLYQLLGAEWVVTSGGPSARGAEPESSILAHAMVELGVPADRILEEPDSDNTYAQAVNLKGLLASRGIDRFVLVTSGVHMPRAMGVFRHVGLEPTASPAPESSSPGAGGWQAILPSVRALETSQAAVREMLGLTYYCARGWLQPASPPESGQSVRPRQPAIEIVGRADERRVGEGLWEVTQVLRHRP